MSTISERNGDGSDSELKAIVERAAHWYIYCTSQELTVNQHKQLHLWLQASPRHLSELLQMPRIDSLIFWYLDPDCARARLNTEVSSLRRAFKAAGIEPDAVRECSQPGSKSRAVRPSVSQMRKAGVFGGVILAVVLGVVRSPQDLEHLLSQCSSSIKLADSPGVSCVGAALVIPQGITPNGIVVVSDPVQFTGIVREIERNPAFMYSLSWRRWEELVAAAWERYGYRVELTPRSGDDGRDVIATRHQGLSVRIFDQVKMRAAHRLVTADEVRATLGALFIEQNVSKAFLSTTSDFAPGVYESSLIRQFVPYRLELRSRGALLAWLSQARDLRSH